MLIILACIPVTLGSFFLFSEILHIERIATIISICLTIVVYLFALFITKTIGKEEVLMLPKGNKIYNKLVKIRLIK